MLELGIGADIVRGIGVVIWVVFAGLMYLAIRKPKTKWRKIGWAAVVLLVFFGPMLPGAYRQYEHKQRYEKAKALFDERCKTAGGKIYRTADAVEGVLLLNVRPLGIAAQRANPNWPDAGLPDEAGGDDYIRTFISWEHQQFPPRRGYLNSQPTNRSGYLTFSGYSFVDVKEDGGIYRYAFKKPPENELLKYPLKSRPARYAVSFRNMTDEVDRSMWVAGTTITITDTDTNEVMAEHTWYSFEPGQGSTAGARAPWGFARTCPELSGWRGGATRMFADQVLKPRKEGMK